MGLYFAQRKNEASWKMEFYLTVNIISGTVRLVSPYIKLLFLLWLNFHNSQLVNLVMVALRLNKERKCIVQTFSFIAYLKKKIQTPKLGLEFDFTFAK